MIRLIHHSFITSTSFVRAGLIAMAVLGYFAAAPQSAAATTFTVNSTVDAPDAAPGDGFCDDGLGACTLRAAVMESNFLGGANVINVPSGTYTLTIGPFDDEFNAGGATMESGDLDIIDLSAFSLPQLISVTISGAGAGSTIINGGAIDRVFDINNFAAFGAHVDVTFQDLTITNGNAPTSPDFYNTPGGAIQFDGFDNQSFLPLGTLTINNCNITNSSAAGQGGGILAIFGSLIMSGSTVSGNTSVNASGGGINYDGSAAAGLRTLQITTSTITNNHANNGTFGNGGGVFEGGNANKSIDHSAITSNTAGAQGGGVYNNGGALTMAYNAIVGNTAAGNPASSGFHNNTGAISAENNWWGCNQGPTVSPCDRVSGPLGSGIASWLFLNHSATPNSILINQATTLQADFFTNNLSTPILASDLVALDGRAVTFNNAMQGTISGADPVISAGKANATFTAGAVGGTGSADATVDFATVTAFIQISEPASVATNPSDQTVCDGSSVSFSASGNGFPAPTVQWQVSTGGPFTDIPGETSNTLTFTATSAQNGNQYRAVFTNAGGTATTTAATLTVNTAPVISTNPVDETVCDGATAMFTAAATSTPAATVQWQVSNGGPFSNIPGATSTTLSFTATAGDNGNQYRAVFTNTCGSTPTTAATLTISPSTTTTDPADETVCQGTNANFSTTAGGTGPFSYAWTVDGSPFGGNTSSISVPTGSLSVGNHTVVVTTTGSCGSASQSATLTVNETTSTTDPADQTVCQGTDANFSTTASGTGPFSYAWTVDGSPFGGNTSSITVPTGSLSVGPHTVVVTTTGACGNASQSATLTVNAPTATTDPADQTVCQGTNANFSTTASGTGPFSYAWTVDGSPFGGNTSSISIPTGALSVGNHTVVVTTTGTCGSASQSATLTVQPPTSATTPGNQTVCKGGIASFSTTASGTGPFTYQWKLDGSNIPGATSSSVNINTTSLSGGNHTVDVVVMGACSTVIRSAVLTVNTAPVVTLNPVSQTATSGTVTFTAAASGIPTPTVQWQVSTDGGFSFSNIPGETSTSLTVAATPANNGNKYRAVFTNGCGTATTTAATLTTCQADLTKTVGLDSVTVSGAGLIDSYSSAGGYPATKGSAANVLSNGTITMGNSGKIAGSARSTQVGINMSGATNITGNATAGTTVSLSGSATVGGIITNNSPAPAISLPSVASCGSYSSGSGITGTYTYNSGTGNLTLSGTNIATLANGTYCFNNVTLTNSAQLKVNGPVVIRLTGTLNASGASSINNTTTIPANLRVLSSYTGSNGISLSNGTNTYMVVYAPRTNVSVSGTAPLFGAVVGKTLSVTNSGAVHFDITVQNSWPDWCSLSNP